MALSGEISYDIKQIGPYVKAHHPLHKRHALGNQQGEEPRFASGVQERLACAQLADTLVLSRERPNGGILGRRRSRDRGEIDEKTLQGIGAKVTPGSPYIVREKAAHDPGEDLSKALRPVYDA